MSIFYRLHWSDCPPFSAENAWSASWGSTRSADGSQTECLTCDGTGELDGEPCSDRDCEEGWTDCVAGYSCCASADELIAYLGGRGEPGADDTVVVFEGRQVDTGFDGEPTAVPERVIETLIWPDFVARSS
ncbi:hypothetical protein ACIPY6_28840 [Streptomyces sp. NPDC090054]|uniref:hypothetical protein n=1 Tax=Streptomyces sp. NPDC090054 TaxID=3365933 RepID=UPI00382BEF08